MKIGKYNIELPYFRGKIAEERLNYLELNTIYKGFTLSHNLEIIECDCSIEKEEIWNYHHNYDDSTVALKVCDEFKWWSLNREDVEKIQKEYIDRYTKILNDETNRLKTLTYDMVSRY